MAKVVKIITGKILADREFWLLENGFEVIASEHKENCILFISGKKNGKNIELVSKYLESKKLEHELTSTIDSYAVVVSQSNKEKAINIIEQWEW